MRSFIITLKMFLVLTILTGLIYPVIVTGIAQLLFPFKANGSLIIVDGKTIGSELIGQEFDTSIYFSPRPSAIAYNPLPSGGSNYGLTNNKLKNLVVDRRKQFLLFNKLDSLTDIPSEMLFSSASGLDPHISQKAAMLQVDRVSAARNLNIIQKRNLVQSIINLTEKPQFSVLGEERVNVLILNLELNKQD